MFCSGCGQPLAPGAALCPQCQQPVAAPTPMGAAAPPIPNLDFQLSNYSGKLRALSTVWFVYAGLMLLIGVGSLTFAHAFLHGYGPSWWHHGNFFGGGPFGSFLMHAAWTAVAFHVLLALAAGFGLAERSGWGRPVAIIAAFFSLFRFPFGTALAIWTLVTTMGYRNRWLYDQLER